MFHVPPMTLGMIPFRQEASSWHYLNIQGKRIQPAKQGPQNSSGSGLVVKSGTAVGLLDLGWVGPCGRMRSICRFRVWIWISSVLSTLVLAFCFQFFGSICGRCSPLGCGQLAQRTGMPRPTQHGMPLCATPFHLCRPSSMSEQTRFGPDVS